MKQAVIAIIPNMFGEFLSISRINNHNDFGLIGGNVELNETPENAICREILEETGLTLDNPILLSEDVLGETTIYTYTFKTVDYRGLKLGVGEEGIVAFKSASQLFNAANTYGDFNNDRIHDYIRKYHLINKHSFVFQMAIGNDIYVVKNNCHAGDCVENDAVIILDHGKAVIIHLTESAQGRADTYVRSTQITPEKLLEQCLKIEASTNKLFKHFDPTLVRNDLTIDTELIEIIS